MVRLDPFPPDNPHFVKDKGVSIWRYLDVPKFMDILERRSLFFSRIDRVGDRLEGSITRADDEFLESRFSPSARSATKKSTARFLLPRTFVSCWHANEYESAAMWKLYADRGIAIRSSVERLESSLRKAELDTDVEAYVGWVRYLDYQNDRSSEPWVERVMCKRKSFEHESELRAVIPLFRTTDDDLPEDGLRVGIDLKDLIEAVNVAPASQDWFPKLIEEIVRDRYGLDVPVLRSSIDVDPIY